MASDVTTVKVFFSFFLFSLYVSTNYAEFIYMLFDM